MSSGRDIIAKDEVRRLSARSGWRGLGLVVHCWAVILAAAGLAVLWPNPLTIALAIAIIGSRQLGLAILMHEAAHMAISPSAKFNNWVGQWLCAGPIFADLAAYRRYHLKHHAHTQTQEDPDLVLSAPFPTSRASLRRKFLRDISGRSGFRLREAQARAAWARFRSGDRVSEAFAQQFAGADLGVSLIVNGAALAAAVSVGAWWAYPVLWLLPLLTWFQLVARIRNIAEHACVGDAGDPWRNTRTTYASWLERAFVAPYFVNYHLEHHLHMYAPCWRLPEIHRQLIDAGLGPRMELARGGYREVLAKAGAG